MNVSVVDMIASVKDYMQTEGVGLGDIVEYNDILDTVDKVTYILTDTYDEEE